MKLENDTYAIIKYRNKPKLCLILNPGSHSAVVDDSLCTEEPINFKYKPEDVMCALGAKPQPGSIYGVKVEPYLKTVNTDKFGPIHFFRDLEKKEVTALRKAMNDIYDFHEKKLSIDFLPLHGINILPKKGKYAGTYRATIRSGKAQDYINLHPADFSDEVYNRYLIAHEFAHGLWFRCVPYQYRARWIKLFEKRLRLNAVKPEHLEELRKDLISYEGGMRAYIKEVADDDDMLMIKEVLAYLKKHHSLDRHNVELLMEFDPEALAEMWPSIAILTEKRQDMGAYAVTKVEEFFAEAMAFHVIGREIPQDVKKGIEATIKAIR